MTAYKDYNFKRSTKGFIVGVYNLTRNIGYKGWVQDNLYIMNPYGNLDVIPAYSMINEKYIIVDLFQSKIMGKSMPWEWIGILFQRISDANST